MNCSKKVSRRSMKTCTPFGSYQCLSGSKLKYVQAKRSYPRLLYDDIQSDRSVEQKTHVQVEANKQSTCISPASVQRTTDGHEFSQPLQGQIYNKQVITMTRVSCVSFLGKRNRVSATEGAKTSDWTNWNSNHDLVATVSDDQRVHSNTGSLFYEGNADAVDCAKETIRNWMV
ncbi:unnamed protein product [Soboliphyme baturini]|uniref:SCP domain-containing protein n=1 Tax=Soboliphyme baturini TaxID=241478 RepID=A0A183IRB6_9BILA|nr:unnamed protein product [Soboliphyme baturini]